MATNNISRLLFVLALAGISPARTDTITHSSAASFALGFPGHQFQLADTLVIPQFDPSLGLLNFLYFDVGINGSLIWETISRDRWGIGFTDFFVRTETTLLGNAAVHNEYPVFGSGGLPCGTAEYQGLCTPTSSKFSNGAGVHTTGTLTGNLNDFTGQGQISMPILFSIETTPYNNRGVQIGNLSRASLGYDALFTYNYTPAPAIANSPEPVYFWLLVIAGSALFLLKRGKLKSGLNTSTSAAGQRQRSNL